MNKKDLRVSVNLDELSNAIQKIINAESEFTIWQNIDNEKHVISGNIKSHFHYQNRLTVDFKIKNSNKISTKTEIFMFSPQLNILIKGKIKLISKSNLKVIIEKKFYIKENRMKPRIDLDKNHFLGEILRKVDQKELHKSEKVKLKDISDNGFGFYVTSSRAIFFQPNSKLIFNSVENLGFSQKVSGSITHITPVTADHGLSNKLMLVGVKFDQAHPNIEAVIQQIKLNQFTASKDKS